MTRRHFALVFLVACGGGGSGNMMMGDDEPPPIDAPPEDPFVPPEGYTRLIGGQWSLPPPSGPTPDRYICVRATVAQDTYVTNIIAQAPTGTHHTVLSIWDNASAPDGQYNCSVGELGHTMLYASGVGTSPLDFPQDVSIKIPAGTKIHLNLHLFNASDNTITGESGIWIKSQPTATPTLAEMVFAGKFAFSIPSNNMDYPVTGGCTSSRDFTLFALWPHMHQIANHSKFELIKGGTAQALHDAPYDFKEQHYYLQSPEVQIQAGDEIRVTCTYRNNTGSPITFGDSSNKEMCFVGMYRYPAAGAGLFECSDNPGF